MENKLFLLRIRGKWKPGNSALIVRAPSESHARVAAFDATKDFRFVENSTSQCDEVTTAGGAGVVHSIEVTSGK